MISQVFPSKFQHICITSVFGCCAQRLSNCCRQKHDPSISRIFFSLIFGGFLTFGPTVRRLRSTCCSRRRLNSVATWITGAHQKLLLRSKNENSNLLYSVVVHSTNSPSRLSERLPGWCRGMCPARGGVQKLQKTTFARHLTPGQNFLIFHCHFSVYENADENAGRSLMNH